jgi:molybdopterin synthase catalytic subunit
MRVRLLLFAGLREAVGKKEHVLELADGASLRDAVARAEAELPPLLHWHGRLMLSRNGERAAPDALVRDGDLIALLPPVSGGAGGSALRAAPLSLDALIAEVSSPACGGVVTFTGVVRDHSRGQAIDHLEYEAYDPLAEAEIARIRDEVRERWPEVRLAVAHRVGRLAIGDAAVMIAAAAPHRPAAFEACRFAIDTLKRTVPIWKKEFGADGGYWVEENP